MPIDEDHEANESKPSRTISSRVLHAGRRFRFEELTIRRAGMDGMGEEISKREIVRHPGAVVILPVLQDGRLVLIHQYRPAIDADIWELPAGTLDQPGEAPIDAARRELLEETGCEAGRLTPLGSFYTTPGLTDEHMHAFLASECVQKHALNLEPGEDLSVCTRDRDEVFEMIRTGDLCDGKSMLTLLLARKLLERLPFSEPGN